MKLRQCLVALFIPFLLQVNAGAQKGSESVPPPRAPLDNGTVGLWQPPRYPSQQQHQWNYPDGTTVKYVGTDTQYNTPKGFATNGTNGVVGPYLAWPGTIEPKEMGPMWLNGKWRWIHNGAMRLSSGDQWGPWYDAVVFGEDIGSLPDPADSDEQHATAGTGDADRQQPEYNYPGGFTITGIRGDTFGNIRGSATNGTQTRPLHYAPVPGTWEPSDFASRDHPLRLGQSAYYMRNGVLHERTGHGPWIRRGRHTIPARDILIGEV